MLQQSEYQQHGQQNEETYGKEGGLAAVPTETHGSEVTTHTPTDESYEDQIVRATVEGYSYFPKTFLQYSPDIFVIDDELSNKSNHTSTQLATIESSNNSQHRSATTVTAANANENSTDAEDANFEDVYNINDNNALRLIDGSRKLPTEAKRYTHRETLFLQKQHNLYSHQVGASSPGRSLSPSSSHLHRHHEYQHPYHGQGRHHSQNRAHETRHTRSRSGNLMGDRELGSLDVSTSTGSAHPLSQVILAQRSQLSETPVVTTTEAVLNCVLPPREVPIELHIPIMADEPHKDQQMKVLYKRLIQPVSPVQSSREGLRDLTKWFNYKLIESKARVSRTDLAHIYDATSHGGKIESITHQFNRPTSQHSMTDTITTTLQAATAMQLQKQKHIQLAGGAGSDLCEVRRTLYCMLFDELIRQVTIDNSERGLLLTRMRDQLRLTLDCAKSLFDSSSKFAVRKQHEATVNVPELKHKIEKLTTQNQALRKEVAMMQSKVRALELSAEERDKARVSKREQEKEFRSCTLNRLKSHLHRLQEAEKKKRVALRQAAEGSDHESDDGVSRRASIAASPTT